LHRHSPARLCRYLDVPGVIGRIGTILGEKGVNIANFALGRERTGAKPVKALSVVGRDSYRQISLYPSTG
jgi:D-3-phosphoglycerate dehydrogenase